MHPASFFLFTSPYNPASRERNGTAILHPLNEIFGKPDSRSHIQKYLQVWSHVEDKSQVSYSVEPAKAHS